MYAVFQCGCSGSTTGGVKSDRVLITFKAISRQVRKILHPSSVTQIMVGRHPVKEEVALSAILYIVLYMGIFLISFFILLLAGVDIVDAFSGSLTSLGNAGPGLDSLSTMGNYNAQPFIAKFIFSIDMIFGRMEIYPVFIVFSMIFRRNK